MPGNRADPGRRRLPDPLYARFCARVAAQPDYERAAGDPVSDAAEVDALRAAQARANRRDPAWFVRTFLPALAFA